MPNGDHRTRQHVRDASIPSSATGNTLDQDVGCPDCGYNLRGLGGDRAACPECGLQSDVAQLVTRQWKQPWYRAPRFTRLCLPAAWSWAACTIVFFSAVVSEFMTAGTSPWLIASLAFGLCLLIWVLLMVVVWQTLDGLTSAMFAALAHAVIAGYLLGAAIVAGGILAAIQITYDVYEFNDDWQWLGLSLSALACVIGVAAVYGARRCERAIAGHCIRVYLRRTTS